MKVHLAYVAAFFCICVICAGLSSVVPPTVDYGEDVAYDINDMLISYDPQPFNSFALEDCDYRITHRKPNELGVEFWGGAPNFDLSHDPNAAILCLYRLELTCPYEITKEEPRTLEIRRK